MEILPATDANLRRAVDALRAGDVIAYPTETVYGLGVDPFNAEALARLYAIKRRDPGNPVLLVVSNLRQLSPLTPAMNQAAKAYAAAFWPGPLSLLLDAAKGLPESLLGPGGKVCVRLTSCAIAAALCEAFGGAIVSTSANVSGEPAARRAADVPQTGVAICIEGGELKAGPASTVLDPATRTILREGAVSKEDIGRISRILPK